ncbi:MAG TPA: amidohydrolase family protein [Gryllotalpicola sp.]
MSHADLHAHYLAPSVLEAIRRGDLAPYIRLIDTPEGMRIAYPGSVTRVVGDRMVGLEHRIAHLDELGFEVQVLSPWIDTFGYELPEDVAVRYHTLLNEGMAAAMDAYPDRFRFLASAPLPYPHATRSVLDHAVRHLGAVGSMIGTNVNGRNLDIPELEALWETSTGLGVPVELHPVNVVETDRLDHDQLDNFLGNPFDTTIAAASLIFGGVLDRHPRLSVILLHGGGYLPYAVGRMTHGRIARGVAPMLLRNPIDYLDRFLYDTVVYDEQTLQSLARIVGKERLLLGTDYPFDMEPDEPVAGVERWLGADALSTIDATAARLTGAPRRTDASKR